MSAQSRNTGRASSTYMGASSIPNAQAAAMKASICRNDSMAPAASLQVRIQARGNGAVSSSRIKPISRSYTIAKELCMPLNRAIMPSRPGTM